MSEKVKIILDITGDAQILIQENNIDLEQFLLTQGYDVNMEFGELYLESEDGARSKAIVTTLIASAASVLAIAQAISKVLSALTNRKHYELIEDWIELRDKDNNIVFDINDKPYFKKVSRIEIIDLTRKESSNTVIDFIKLYTIKISDQKS